MVADVALGKTIRQCRREIGLSQAQLASSAGLSQGYLSQIENAEVDNPSAAVLFRLARALHIDPHRLLAAAGYPQVANNDGGQALEPMIDPDLLAFLARLSPAQQQHLLHFFQALEKGAEELVGQRDGNRRQVGSN
jgi:transcriptional regulator with XRE-family HTH domain